MQRVKRTAARSGRAARPANPQTLTEQAYRQLEEQIVTLRLKPGEFLSEYALAEGLDIGRTPIREALQRLAREGLVTILPRKGILVSETDPRKQLLVLEVRRELERLLARLGAQRASEEQRASFRQIADGMDRAAKSNDDIAFMRLDRELNAADLGGRPQRLRRARHALPARPFAPLLVHALQGTPPTCRCARGCMRRRRARSPTATPSAPARPPTG